MSERFADNPARRRYELHEDGKLAGFAQYRRSADTIMFTHTETDPAFRGAGVAGRLVAAALADARKQGLDVLPLCPYVREWLASHPEYTDLVPEPQRATFGL